MRKINAITLAFCLALPTLGHAASMDTSRVAAEDGYWYLGARVGASSFQDVCSTGNTKCDNETVGYGLYGGYQVLPWLGIEVGANDYGTPEAQYGDSTVKASAWDAQLSTVLSYPLYQELDAYARLGAAYVNIDKTSTWDEDQDAQEWEMVSALGLKYTLSPDWEIRGEYQYIDGIGNDELLQGDMHSVFVGLNYRFGGAQDVVMAAPVVATQVVEPTPVEKPPVVMNKVTLDATSLFEFNSSTVKPNPDLDRLVDTALKDSDGRILITGHTDSTGSERVNQRLSEQRANAVANTLVEQGVDAQRITAQGKGERQPVASNMTAEGRAQNRRVDIELESWVESDIHDASAM